MRLSIKTTDGYRAALNRMLRSFSLLMTMCFSSFVDKVCIFYKSVALFVMGLMLRYAEAMTELAW